MTKTMNHAEYVARMKTLPNNALRFIMKDAQELLGRSSEFSTIDHCGKMFKHAEDELKHRQKTMHKWEASVGDQIATLNRVDTMLRMAGYTGQDTLDNLRDLIKSAKRPATEEDES